MAHGVSCTCTRPAAAFHQILLLAERAVTGNGLARQVPFTATDDRGGSGSVNVGVPHSKKDIAGDNGQFFNSFDQVFMEKDTCSH